VLRFLFIQATVPSTTCHSTFTSISARTLLSVGTLGQSLGTIVMPLSESLVDSTQANWRDADIGVGGWLSISFTSMGNAMRSKRRIRPETSFWIELRCQQVVSLCVSNGPNRGAAFVLVRRLREPKRPNRTVKLKPVEAVRSLDPIIRRAALGVTRSRGLSLVNVRLAPESDRRGAFSEAPPPCCDTVGSPLPFCSPLQLIIAKTVRLVAPSLAKEIRSPCGARPHFVIHLP
jgi:hypothetical protein